jgi:hypothetical protein
MAGEGVAGSHAVPVEPQGERDALIKAAITGRRPMAAIYDGRERLFCPYMPGRNKEGHSAVSTASLCGVCSFISTAANVAVDCNARRTGRLALFLR